MQSNVIFHFISIKIQFFKKQIVSSILEGNDRLRWIELKFHHVRNVLKQ